MRAAFESLKIQSKLMVVFGLIISIGVLITGWTVLAISNLDNLTIELEETEFELSEAVQARNLLKQLEIAELSFVITDDEEFLHEHAHILSSVELYLRNAVIRTDDVVMGDVLYRFGQHLEGYTTALEDVVEAVEQGEHARAEELGVVSAESLEGMDGEVGTVIGLMQPKLEEKSAESKRQVLLSGIVGAVILVVFLALALGAGSIVNRQISSPILILMNAVSQIEDGNFDPSLVSDLVGRQDEIGHLARSFVHMAEDIGEREDALHAEAEDLRRKLSRI